MKVKQTHARDSWVCVLYLHYADQFDQTCLRTRHISIGSKVTGCVYGHEISSLQHCLEWVCSNTLTSLTPDCPQCSLGLD